MTNRMTWEEIGERYPNQWVGLTDVEYEQDSTITIQSAVVKYADKSKDELTMLMLQGEIVARHTNPDGIFQLGMVGATL